jgi:diguanylate cyclase (GGDEF)-like protein/PAS domain S-box-containing protein
MFPGKESVVANLLLTIALTVVMPAALGHLLTSRMAITFVSIPLHSVLETTGGIIAIVISMIFYLKYSKILVLTHFNWSTTSLLAMGIIDIFHASVMPGKMFVWLHSTAVLFGGIFFISVWLPHRRVSSRIYRSIPLLFIGFSLLFAFVSLENEASIPPMLNPDGSFSETANLLNIIGGAGFFIASLRFLINYIHSKEYEELLFAGHTMLFGIAGGLFITSMIWDMQWWLWHMLRLLAYVVAFYVLYMEYRRELHIVELANHKLETANRKISEYLEIVDKHVITSSTDARGIITEVSQAFCNISGYSKEELIGRSHNIVRHPDMPHELYREMWTTIRSGRPWHGEIKNRKKDGGFYWVDAVITPSIDSSGQVMGYTAIRQDITNKKRVEVLSITDELSGLYNRRYFNETIHNEFARARREGRNLAFCIMDIDHFKQYNDTYGHQKGDRAIEAVGEVLRTHTRRPGDFAFRLGGEEFGLLFGAEDAASARGFAEQIREAIAALKMEHKANSAGDYLTVSMGLALCSAKVPDRCEALYSEADKRLYEAKRAGRNRLIAGI